MLQENETEYITNKAEKGNENAEQIHVDTADETMEHISNKKFIFIKIFYLLMNIYFFKNKRKQFQR